MTRPGGRITVHASVVTGIRIEPSTASLGIEAVDQAKDGSTLAYHAISAPAVMPDVVGGDHPPIEQPEAIAKAIRAIVHWAQQLADEA